MAASTVAVCAGAGRLRPLRCLARLPQQNSRTPATSARARPQQALTHALLVAKAGSTLRSSRAVAHRPKCKRTPATGCPRTPATHAPRNRRPRTSATGTHARAKSWQHPEGLRAVPHPSTNNAHAGDCANASGENCKSIARAPCQQPATDGKEKGLRDRNSPTCTLSQNGYGASRSPHCVSIAAPGKRQVENGPRR